jgi:hypothetical protein
MNDVNIMFDPKNTLLEGINGEAYTLGNKTFLVINETKWNNLKTESAKELLIFHELGHGVLGRNHKEFHTSTIVTDNLNRKIPASIMGRPKVPSYVYEKNRDAYLHELFHSPNNEELDLSILQRSISMYKDETVMFTISDIKLNSGVDLEINKNNVTKIPIILTIKGIIKGDKNIKIDKMIEVPSDIDGINSSTKIELLKDRRDLGKGVITIDITLMIGETKMDQKSLRIKSLNSFEI